VLQRSVDEAQEFIERSSFRWHQGFELVPGVRTPGRSDTARMIELCELPENFQGMTVLDIGTSNGALCFEAERRGAGRVVGIDIVPIEFHGFAETRTFLGSNAEFYQGSVYELWELFDEPFDVVFFLGVLYHLRHPLLALDAIRAFTRSLAFIETTVADRDVGDLADRSLALFYRKADLNNDSSNWFQPSTQCLLDWCFSCGFEPELLTPDGKRPPKRRLVRGVPISGIPEYLELSYERPIRATLSPH
jgi:tRNA (mo5U34)-methyltransferase